MLKRAVIAAMAISTCLAAAFVAKETVFFDSGNPYGAKEISADFRESLPPAAGSRIEDFTLPSNYPLPEEEARRAALEFAVARLRLDQYKGSLVDCESGAVAMNQRPKQALEPTRADAGHADSALRPRGSS